MPAAPGSERPSLLVVDDDEIFRERLARALRERRLRGAHVRATSTAACRPPPPTRPRWRSST